MFAFATVVRVTPLSPQLPATMFEIVTPIDLRPMAATGVPPGDIVIALAFAVAATAVAAAAAAAAAAVVASTFGGGGVGVCDIVALLGKSWV